MHYLSTSYPSSTLVMDIDDPPHASSSSRTKTVYIPETTYADISPSPTFDYRSLPDHSQAICIDAGETRCKCQFPMVKLMFVRVISMASRVLQHEDALHRPH